MLKNKLTQKELRQQTRWFESNIQPDMKSFDNLSDHLEYTRQRKEWSNTNTHIGEALVNIESLELLITKGNTNSTKDIEHCLHELKWNLKHMKAGK